MGRSTFDGPILSGDTRFGDFRNVGSVEIYQAAGIDLATTTVNTALYSGGSGVFVDSNGIPNGAAVVYTPSATTFPPTVQTIPADTATNVYRGWVAYIPVGCKIVEMTTECQAVVAVAGGTAAVSSATVYMSNNYTAAGGTPTYGATGAISAVGRQSNATQTATQITNVQSTSQDVLTPGANPNISQVVFTLAIVGTALDTRTSLTGRFYFSVAYIQPDGSIGSTTAYPYGNFD